ncbi:MAG: hypothetical protein ACJAVV_001752 [Alphaproteobacteria bacterium]|jgi:hypothetical protein
MTSAQSYNAKNEGAIEHSLLYASINLPSAPKPSLYVENKHFTQYARQANSLHTCKHPSILIQFYNSLQPHSLHCTKEEQKLPVEVIENTSVFVQNTLKPDEYIRQYKGVEDNPSNNKEQHEKDSNSNILHPHDIPYESLSELPASEFVNATFASIEQGMAVNV